MGISKFIDKIGGITMRKSATILFVCAFLLGCEYELLAPTTKVVVVPAPDTSDNTNITPPASQPAAMIATVDVPADTITSTTADIVMSANGIVKYMLEVITGESVFDTVESNNASGSGPNSFPYADYYTTWILPESGLTPNTGYLVVLWYEDQNGNVGSSHTSFITKPAVPEPAAPEVCGDGIDNNGNGQTDEGCPLQFVGDIGIVHLSYDPTVTVRANYALGAAAAVNGYIRTDNLQNWILFCTRPAGVSGYCQHDFDPTLNGEMRLEVLDNNGNLVDSWDGTVWMTLSIEPVHTTEITSATAKISWGVNKHSSVLVQYGIDGDGYTNQVPAEDSGSVVLSGLIPNINYHYLITATNETGEGHETKSVGPFTFTTLPLNPGPTDCKVRTEYVLEDTFQPRYGQVPLLKLKSYADGTETSGCTPSVTNMSFELLVTRVTPFFQPQISVVIDGIYFTPTFGYGGAIGLSQWYYNSYTSAVPFQPSSMGTDITVMCTNCDGTMPAGVSIQTTLTGLGWQTNSTSSVQNTYPNLDQLVAFPTT